MHTRALAVLLPLLLLKTAAWGAPSAHPAKNAKRPAALVSSPAQADGIVSATVDALWAQTDQLWHVGDYPRIVALDRVIVQADPRFVECYNTGAWLMWSMGRLGDAQMFYKMGAQNNPDDPAAYLDWGMFTLRTLHNGPAAVRIFAQDAALPDAGPNDWKMLAHACKKAGDLPRAIATWRHIKKRWPDAPAVDSNLARVLALQASASPKSAAPKTPAP